MLELARMLLHLEATVTFRLGKNCIMGEARQATRRTDRAVSTVRATSMENNGYQSTQTAGGNVWKYEDERGWWRKMYKKRLMALVPRHML